MVHLEEAQKTAQTIAKGLPKTHQEAIVKHLDKNFKLTVSSGEDISDYTRSPQHVNSVLQFAGITLEDQSKETLHIVWKYYESLVKVKEKEGLVQMIKSEQMKAIVKVLSPILQDLMVEIYVVSDLPQLFVDGLVLVKKVITVSETAFKTEQQRQNAYRDLSVELTAVCFSLFFFFFPSNPRSRLVCLFCFCFFFVFWHHSSRTSCSTTWRKRTMAPFTNLRIGSWIYGTTPKA